VSEPVTSLVVDRPTVCIDFKNPKAYLTLAPTFALEDELGIAFDWLPLIVSPMSRPKAEQPGEDRGTRHRRIRAQYYERDTRRYASVYGIELGDLYRNPDVSIASIGLLWAKERSPTAVRAYLKSVFERYWAGGFDIEEAAAIERIMRDVGIGTAGWASFVAEPGRASLDSTSAMLRGAGLFDVPAYVVDDELFFGRQHLPMIRWMLTGKVGEPPI
jgi:2-hydroxychromene-2-carboxylate isomerase